MVNLSNSKINKFLQQGDSADTTTEQGHSFEELICYIFGKIPGVTITARNEFNVFRTQEIDVALWNEKKRNNLDFLPNLILIECKNWSVPARGETLGWFRDKLVDRGMEFGIFVARNGISGENDSNPGAHEIIGRALSQGIRIIVITGEEIEQLRNTIDLVTMIKTKLCQLAVGMRGF